MDEHDDLDRRMDERLARAGRVWRESLPAAREPDLVAPGRHRARWLVPSAAAAAVALVVGGVVGLVGHGGGADAPLPGASSSAAGVVPWAALPATHPRLPVRWVGPTAATIYAARPCGTGDVDHGKAVGGGAAGTAYVTTRLSLAPGHSSCRLPASFGARLLDHGTPIPTGPSGLGGRRPVPVLITRAWPAELSVGWSVTHVCGHVDNTTIRVSLIKAGTFDLPGFGRTTCNPGEPMTEPLDLPAIQPGYTQQRVSPYDGVRVSGDLRLTGRPGQTVDFTITLTSRRDLVLDPCPDYRIGAYTPIQSESRVATYGLNCAQVPYRAAAGTPYLPAGVPVTFAMQLTAPAVDVPKLEWELLAPPTLPALGGVLTVGTAQPDGTLTGVVTMDGGPAPGTSTKVTSGTVTLVGDDGTRRVASIAADGTYTAHVPAGAYTLVVRTPQWNGGALFKDRAGVTGGAVTTADVSLPMK
ncbi:hypothetical protein GCM10028801_23070 [Nocardioides maradonensis]